MASRDLTHEYLAPQLGDERSRHGAVLQDEPDLEKVADVVRGGCLRRT